MNTLDDIYVLHIPAELKSFVNERFSFAPEWKSVYDIWVSEGNIEKTKIMLEKYAQMIENSF